MSNVPVVVGITGGIASGKSTARVMFQDLGVACVDIDMVARSIHQNPSHPVCSQLLSEFPDWVDAEGRLLRGSLRQYFSVNAAANKRLISILKPHIAEVLWAWTKQQSSAYVMWESALLLQEDMLDYVSDTMNQTTFHHRILYVKSDQASQLRRLLKRQSDWSVEDARRIIESQTDEITFVNMADDILINNSDLESLAAAVRGLHSAYCKIGEIR